jgi:hypothetical protein
MGKIRRGGFVFVTWKGDHGPRDLPMKGHPTRRLLRLIAELKSEERH